MIGDFFTIGFPLGRTSSHELSLEDGDGSEYVVSSDELEPSTKSLKISENYHLRDSGDEFTHFSYLLERFRGPESWRRGRLFPGLGPRRRPDGLEIKIRFYCGAII